MLCVFNDPRDNLRKWYESFYGGDKEDFTRLESVTSASTLPDFRRGVEHFGQLLQRESLDRQTLENMLTLWPRFSLTELRYEITGKSGDTAWVRVTGDLIAATTLGQDRIHIDDSVRMVKEDGEWRFRCFEKRFMSGFERRLVEEIFGPHFLECR
ncbi:MAG TPA: hypothetical protein VM163_12485 [bacterium]|nr:hypothetical protein [bacterium]